MSLSKPAVHSSLEANGRLWGDRCSGAQLSLIILKSRPRGTRCTAPAPRQSSTPPAPSRSCTRAAARATRQWPGCTRGCAARSRPSPAGGTGRATHNTPYISWGTMHDSAHGPRYARRCSEAQHPRRCLQGPRLVLGLIPKDLPKPTRATPRTNTRESTGPHRERVARPGRSGR